MSLTLWPLCQGLSRHRHMADGIINSRNGLDSHVHVVDQLVLADHQLARINARRHQNIPDLLKNALQSDEAKAKWPRFLANTAPTVHACDGRHLIERSARTSDSTAGSHWQYHDPAKHKTSQDITPLPVDQGGESGRSQDSPMPVRERC